MFKSKVLFCPNLYLHFVSFLTALAHKCNTITICFLCLWKHFLKSYKKTIETTTENPLTLTFTFAKNSKQDVKKTKNKVEKQIKTVWSLLILSFLACSWFLFWQELDINYTALKVQFVVFFKVGVYFLVEKGREYMIKTVVLHINAVKL